MSSAGSSGRFPSDVRPASLNGSAEFGAFECSGNVFAHIEATWPGGRVEALTSVEGRRVVTIKES